MLAFTYNWKKPKLYIILLISSVFGFVLFAVIHNFFEGIGKGTYWGVVGGFFFLLAVLICPAGIIIGIGGSIVTAIKTKKNNIH